MIHLAKKHTVVNGVCRRHAWVMLPDPEGSRWNTRACARCGLVRRTLCETSVLSSLKESSWTGEDYALHAPFDDEASSAC
jgi:hypothetical protein